MGESGTEAVDEIAQREVAFEEIFVIILDVIGQLAHERCVDLLEPAQGITAGIEHVVVADLPPFQLGALPGPLFAANLDRFARERVAAAALPAIAAASRASGFED